MAVIKEFRCPRHGGFEGTHEICPAYGCDSEGVEREFRTPTAISKGLYKRHEAGIRRLAESYGISNFNSAQREGDVSFAGRAKEENAKADPAEMVLWGNEGVEKVFKGGLPAAVAAAAQPLSVPNIPASDPHLTHNSAMRNLANDPGAPPLLRQKSTLPPAQIIRDQRDVKT